MAAISSVPPVSVCSSGHAVRDPSFVGLSFAYEMQASATQLPVIDCSKGIKNVLLSDTWLRRCNLFLHHYKRVIGAATYVGGSLGASSLFCPAEVARIFGPACMVLTLPGVIAGILVLRFDMVRVLLRTYEFWYLSVTNAVAMLLMAVHFNDLRACTMLSAVYGFQITILLDASYRAVSTTMLASVVAAFSMSVFGVFSLLGLVDQACNPAIFKYGSRVVSTVDGIANALATVVVMLLRNALRKFLVDRELDDGGVASTGTASTVRCITYRCRVRLCLADGSACRSATIATVKGALIHPQRVLVRDNSSYGRLATSRTQLQFIPTSETFNPAHTLFQFIYEPLFRPISRPWRLLLHSLQAVGTLSTVLALSIHPSSHSVPYRLISFVAIGSTSAFCGVYMFHQHRRLLRRVCLSFDFAFVSTQLSVVHLCVCDTVSWDSRCLAVCSSWLWIHWVLTLDTVTPVMRVRLGYHRWTARLVLVFFLVAHVALSLELVMWNHLQLQDRAVFEAVLWDHSVHVRVVPMLFGRMITTFCWSLRLLFRLVKRSDDELIVLQGTVMYEDFQRQLRRKSSTALIQPSMAPRNCD